MKFRDLKEFWKKSLDGSERSFIRYVLILCLICLFTAAIILLSDSIGNTDSLNSFLTSASAIALIILMIEGPRFFNKVDRRLKYQQDKQNTILRVIRETVPILVTLVDLNLTEINEETFNSDIKKLNATKINPRLAREKREIALNYWSQLLKLPKGDDQFNFLENLNQDDIDLVIKKLLYQLENLEKLIIRYQYSFFNNTDHVFKAKLEDLIYVLQIEVLDQPKKLEVMKESDDAILEGDRIINKKNGKMIFKNKEEYLKQIGKGPLKNYLQKLKELIELLS